MKQFAYATKEEINAYKDAELCKRLCGIKPFGSRHWEYPWTVEHSGILDRKNLRILDVAPDFTFPYASFLENRHRVTFIDLEKREWSDGVVWGGDENSLRNASDFRTMDVCNLSFEDETFDAVFCISVLEHIVCPTQDPYDPELERLFSAKAAIPALREMHRCLKPDGRLLLTVDIYGGERWKPLFCQWDIISDIKHAGFSLKGISDFSLEKIFNSPDAYISQFHGPYITLGFCLTKD